MKKIFAIIISLLVLTLSLTLATTPVQAYIDTYHWIMPFYKGYDPFYGDYVTAYKTGSTAQLLVRVYNNWGGYPSITITDVKVLFDWNVNYTTTECPYVMLYGEYHNFIIDFGVPDTDVASNAFAHSYVIFVEFTYDSSESYWSYYPWEYFAVYSLGQADAMDASMELSAKLSYVPYFHSYEARMMLSKAQTESSIGSQYYMRGNFTTAKTHYETGLNLFDGAFEIESDYAKTQDEYSIASQEAELNYYTAQANATKTQADAAMTEANAALKEADAAMKQAEAAMIEANATKTQADAAVILANATLNQSYAWLLFGIGFIIISIGVLAYAIKKPKTPKPL